jgi:hypothetical protein
VKDINRDVFSSYLQYQFNIRLLFNISTFSTTMSSSTFTETQESISLTTSSKVPAHGKLRYIKRGIIPTASPHLYHLPPLAEFGDVRSMPITDVKPSLDLGDASPFTLETHGFAARRHPSTLHSPPYSRAAWNNETLLKTIYIPEIEALVQKLTGSRIVITESALIRSCIHTEVDGLATCEDKDNPEAETEDPFPKMIGTIPGSGASPAPKVHLDFSPTGARTHLRKYHQKLAEAGSGVIAAEEKLIESGIMRKELTEQYNGPRWAMFSIWRPLKPVKRDPLAFADRRSFPKADYVPVKVVEPTGKNIANIPNEEKQTHGSETYLAYGADQHSWCWIWDMQPEEVVVIQLFDSEAEKSGMCGVMHSSVDVPGTENEAPRESIEIRCTAFW